MAAALGRSFGQLLVLALERIAAASRTEVSCICISESHFELIERLDIGAGSSGATESGSSSGWHGLEMLRSAAVEESSLGKARVASLWAWREAPGFDREAAAISTLAWPLCVGAVMTASSVPLQEDPCCPPRLRSSIAKA
eukprot:TRINITY_DN54271_c0_g1_i1.p1 TRINITY_DN54271_c0_g1~~TRINITY_DN54271_c0_g1_i1.p1  ORF type:complete len:158 (+),score=38.36 TRINITY_DN54271_c0_g1_i1:55-474(+)